MRAIVLAVSVALTGCAAQPHRIQPQFVSDTPFRAMDCSTLSRELGARDQRLIQLNTEQSKAATADVAWVTVGTLLVWPAYFGLLATPNHKDEIARLKGENIAIVNAQGANCSPPPGV